MPQTAVMNVMGLRIAFAVLFVAVFVGVYWFNSGVKRPVKVIELRGRCS